jgi:hypothetical protein
MRLERKKKVDMLIAADNIEERGEERWLGIGGSMLGAIRGKYAVVGDSPYRCRHSLAHNRHTHYEIG